MKYFYLFVREKVTTMKITTLKTKKNIEKFVNHHYIKMWITTLKISVFLIHHYYENQNVKKNEKNIESMFVLSDFHILTTYGVSTYGVLAKQKKI